MLKRLLDVDEMLVEFLLRPTTLMMILTSTYFQAHENRESWGVLLEKLVERYYKIDGKIIKLTQEDVAFYAYKVLGMDPKKSERHRLHAFNLFFSDLKVTDVPRRTYLINEFVYNRTFANLQRDIRGSREKLFSEIQSPDVQKDVLLRLIQNAY